MLIDIHGGPYVVAGYDSEYGFGLGARVTARLGTDDHEYIWTLGLKWECPWPGQWDRYWWADCAVEDHGAYVRLLGFKLYATWW